MSASTVRMKERILMKEYSTKRNNNSKLGRINYSCGCRSFVSGNVLILIILRKGTILSFNVYHRGILLSDTNNTLDQINQCVRFLYFCL